MDTLAGTAPPIDGLDRVAGLRTAAATAETALIVVGAVELIDFVVSVVVVRATGGAQTGGRASSTNVSFVFFSSFFFCNSETISERRPSEVVEQVDCLHLSFESAMLSMLA